MDARLIRFYGPMNLNKLTLGQYFGLLMAMPEIATNESGEVDHLARVKRMSRERRRKEQWRKT